MVDSGCFSTIFIMLKLKKRILKEEDRVFARAQRAVVHASCALDNDYMGASMT